MHIMKKQKWKYLRWDFLRVVWFHALHQVGEGMAWHGEINPSQGGP
jgi:hypothetical protein